MASDQNHTAAQPATEIDEVRKSAQEWAKCAEYWMNRHDKLLAFIRADPARLIALHAWESLELS